MADTKGPAQGPGNSDLIAAVAYRLWERQGAPYPGSNLDDWFAAERAVNAALYDVGTRGALLPRFDWVSVILAGLETYLQLKMHGGGPSGAVQPQPTAHIERKIGLALVTANFFSEETGSRSENFESVSEAQQWALRNAEVSAVLRRAKESNLCG